MNLQNYELQMRFDAFGTVFVQNATEKKSRIQHRLWTSTGEFAVVFLSFRGLRLYSSDEQMQGKVSRTR